MNKPLYTRPAMLPTLLADYLLDVFYPANLSEFLVDIHPRGGLPKERITTRDRRLISSAP